MNLSLGPKMNWLWLFPAVGAALLIAALLCWQSRLRFEAHALRADGEVTALIRSESTDSDGRRSETWCPEVRFTTDTGRSLTFTGRTCSSPPSRHVGERAVVLYPRGEPESARLDGFGERWLAVLVLGGIGSVFLLIGLALTVPMLRRRRNAAELKVSGRPIMAKVIDVSQNTSVKINGGSPWRIQAQWLDPATNRMHVFDSDYIWFDPSPYVGAEIRVLVDPDRASRYWVDTGGLPELA